MSDMEMTDSEINKALVEVMYPDNMFMGFSIADDAIIERRNGMYATKHINYKEPAIFAVNIEWLIENINFEIKDGKLSIYSKTVFGEWPLHLIPLRKAAALARIKASQVNRDESI